MEFHVAKTLLPIFAAFFCSQAPASAGLIITFKPTDLIVNPNGGAVNQSLDLLVSHDGVGSNLFSGYEIELNPLERVTISEGLINASDFNFDLGHQVLSSAPWSILGVNNVANNTVVLGGTNLLARLSLTIDTSAGFPSSIDLQPTMVNATRGGIFGTDITGEFSITPASLTIATVPEPMSFGVAVLVLLTTACHHRKRMSRSKFGKADFIDR